MTDTPNTPDTSNEAATEPARSGTTEQGATPSLARLLETYTAWSGRHVLVDAAKRADAAGDADRAEALRLLAGDDTSAPSAVEALRAQHELASLLQGWRWQTVAAAREHGATWVEIGAATRRDPTEELADYLAAVDQQARFGDLDDQRLAGYRAAADIPDSDEADPDVDRDVGPGVDEAERWRGRPAAPDPLAPDLVHGHPGMPADLAGLDETELLAHAEHSDAAARHGTGEERVAAEAELDAASDEAERRAEKEGPDSVPAQVAGYISLLREDTDHALADEASAWRADLDPLLLAAARTRPSPPPSAAPAGRTAADIARDVDARMQAPQPPEREEGSAVPGRVRAPSQAERADFDHALTDSALADRAEPRDRAEDLVEGAGVGVTGFDPATGTYSDPEIGSRCELGEPLRGLEALEALAPVAEHDLDHSPPDDWPEQAVSTQDGYLDCRITGPGRRRVAIGDHGSQETTAGADTAETLTPAPETASPEPVDVPGLQQRIDRMRARLAVEQHHAAGEQSDRRDRLAHWSADLTGLDHTGPQLHDSPTHRTADGRADGDAL